MKHGFVLLAAIILALQGVLYTYDGWYGICYFGGEIRDPKRDVTRSMFGGVLSVIAIYVLVNFALLHMTAITSAAIRSRVSFGMSFGPNRPTSPSIERAGVPASRAVGTSGSIGARSLFISAITFTFPACTCGRMIA